MTTRKIVPLVLSAFILGLSVPCHAQTDGNTTAPEGASPPDPKTLTNPNDKHAVTEAEIAECMKTWDPQTGMTKQEYEQSCKSTLKYYPEKP